MEVGHNQVIAMVLSTTLVFCLLVLVVVWCTLTYSNNVPLSKSNMVVIHQNCNCQSAHNDAFLFFTNLSTPTVLYKLSDLHYITFETLAVCRSGEIAFTDTMLCCEPHNYAHFDTTAP